MFLRDGDPNKAASWAADRALVGRALARDRAALDEFIIRMRSVPRFVAVLHGRFADRLSPESLEDLVQDVLTTVWRRLADYRGDAALDTWVFRICDFHLRNAYRRQALRRVVSLDDTGEPATETTESAGDHEAVERAIEALPEDEARVLRLKHFEGLTFDEIATQLEQSANTSKTRYYRGLEALRRRLETPEESQ